MDIAKKRGSGNILFGWVLKYFAHVFYIAGITVLIPLLFSFSFSDIATPSPQLFSAAVASVLAGTIMLFMQKRTIAGTVKSLGLMTFIPGIVALAVMLFGGEMFYNIGTIGPFLRSYIEKSVPRAWMMTLGYLLMGFVLWLIGSKFVRKHKIRVTGEILKLKKKL